MDQNLSYAAVQEVEQLLGTKIYPGTESTKDVGAYHFARAGEGHHSVLVPQPSAGLHDPLNWSPIWKGLALFCATALPFSQTFGPLALAPMFGSYMQEWGLADVVQFTGVAILVLGSSNFVWVPIMVCFGRRPVAILSTVVCLCRHRSVHVRAPFRLVAERLTRRNNGVRESEERLVAMMPDVLVMIVGNVATAVGYDEVWPWRAIVVVGYAALGMQVAGILSIASTYAVDSHMYKPVTGPSLS